MSFPDMSQRCFIFNYYYFYDSKALEWPSWVGPSSWLTNKEIPLAGVLFKPVVSHQNVDYFLFPLGGRGHTSWYSGVTFSSMLGEGPSGAWETMCCPQYAKHAPQPV